MDYIDDEREFVVSNFKNILRDINIDLISGNLNFNYKPNISKIRKKNILFNHSY